MSIPAVTGDYFEVRILGNHDAQRVMTVLHYILDDMGETLTVEGVCNGLNTSLNAANDLLAKYFICLNHEYVGVATQIQRVAPARSVYYNFAPHAENGIVEGDGLPPGNSAAITKRADTAGRSKVGGVRVPALSQGDVDAGILTEAAVAGLQTFADKLKINQPAGFGDATFIPIIFHRANPSLSVPVTQVIVQPQARTMARRVVGRGI